jgi:hypothetical protein
LVRAGIALFEQRRHDALSALVAAEEVFEQCRMEHYLAATRWRIAELDPADTRRRNLAEAWMTRQNVRNPSRLAHMLAPGRCP